MPELPDVTIYQEALQRHIEGRPLDRIRLANPFLLRSVDPPYREAEGRTITGVRRLGKRLVWALDGELFIVLHLMIAGRLRWRAADGKGPPKVPGKIGLAAFDFPNGTLILTEAGSKRRASLHVVAGEAALAEHDPGGLELLGSTAGDFAAALRREKHTVKRALTDPHLFSGIGNAYSDEILHRAQLSPFKPTSNLTDDEVARLHAATISTLQEWIERLRAEVGDGFPDKVTAFHAEMAVHGRYGKPCPVCGSPVQRVVHSSSEFNYCATCQTGGKVLADRALSRLLRDDWPRTLEDLEQLRTGRRSSGG